MFDKGPVQRSFINAQFLHLGKTYQLVERERFAAAEFIYD